MQIDRVTSLDETLEEINEALAKSRQEETQEDSDSLSSFTIYTSNMSLSFGRKNPLPPTCFADSSELWLSMVEQERRRAGLRDPNYLSRHSELTAKMRAILVDWLNEVRLSFEHVLVLSTAYQAEGWFGIMGIFKGLWVQPLPEINCQKC